jgi:hypothetical protein
MTTTTLQDQEVKRWMRNYGFPTRITCEDGRIALRWWHGSVYHNCEVIPGVTVDIPARHWYGYQAIEGPATVLETHDFGRPDVYVETADENTAGLRW